MTLIAGETSGDQYAADLINDLQQQARYSMIFNGVGSQAMRQAGATLWFDSEAICVVGLAEIWQRRHAIRQAFRTVKFHLAQQRPDYLILIDYPGFNLRIARYAKHLGIRVLYYISPQVWAWRAGRIQTIKRYVDHMAVLFPFEKVLYQAHHVPVTQVQHPLLSRVQPQNMPQQLYAKWQLNPQHPVITFMPGSRPSEVQRLLPVLIETIAQMHKEYPERQYLLPAAPGLNLKELPCMQDHHELITHHCLIWLDAQEVYDALSISDAAIIASGTATLEAALLGTPMVVVYATHPLTYWVGKRLVKIPHISLVNIIAQKEVVPELIQHALTVENILQNLEKILKDQSYRHTMQRDLQAIKACLEQESSQQTRPTTAELVLNLLKQ